MDPSRHAPGSIRTRRTIHPASVSAPLAVPATGDAMTIQTTALLIAICVLNLAFGFVLYLTGFKFKYIDPPVYPKVLFPLLAGGAAIGTLISLQSPFSGAALGSVGGLLVYFWFYPDPRDDG
jgi:hypothetical protein